MDTQARLPIHAKRIIIGTTVRNAEGRFNVKVLIIKVRRFFLEFHCVHPKPKIYILIGLVAEKTRKDRTRVFWVKALRKTYLGNVY